jgi:hypothetical protein
MKMRQSFPTARAAVFFALCLAVATGAAADAQPASPIVMEPSYDGETERPGVLVATDDQQGIVIRLDPEAKGEIQVLAPPRHGGFEFEFNTAIFYPYSSDYLGRDSMTLALDGVVTQVELMILPRRLPFVGRFDGANETPALWDNRSRTFGLCDKPADDQYQLTCVFYPVVDLDEGAFIPLAWPVAGGKDVPVLFDPAAGRFHFLENRGDSFAVSEVIYIPGSRGAWPILGDFGGTGQRELVMVTGDGRIFKNTVKGNHSWPARFAVSGDDLVWPILVPRVGGDAVGLVSPESCDVHSLRLDQLDGVIYEEDPAYVSGDCRRPLAWFMSPLSNLAPGLEIFFLRPTDDGELPLVPGKYKASKPQTIPVKFPDDPAGGG